MIFGRRKRAEQAAAENAEERDEAVEATPEDDEGKPEPVEDAEVEAEPALDVETLDATEWRTDGPFDLRELHDEPDEDDEHPRIDLGSLILTGLPGSELRLQVSEDT